MVIFDVFFPLFVLNLSVNEFFKSPFQRQSYYIIAKLDSDTITGIILADVINSQHGLLEIRYYTFFTVDNHQKQDLSKLSRYHTVEKGHHARFFALWSNGALLSNVIKFDSFPWDCNTTMDFDERLFVSRMYSDVFRSLSGYLSQS